MHCVRLNRLSKVIYFFKPRLIRIKKEQKMNYKVRVL